MRTPKLHRHSTVGIGGGVRAVHFRRYAEMLRRCGPLCAELAGHLEAILAHHDAIVSAASNAEETVKAEKAALSRRIAAGDIDATTAAAQLAKVEAKASLAGPAKDLTDEARVSLIRDEVRRLRDEADALVLEMLAPTVEAAAVEIRDAVAALPDDVVDDRTAVIAGAADDWRTALEAIDRIATAWMLADRWRKDGILWTIKQAGPKKVWEWAGDPPVREPGTPFEWAERIGEGRRPTVLTASQFVELLPPPTAAEVNAQEVHAAYQAQADKVNAGLGTRAGTVV